MQQRYSLWLVLAEGTAPAHQHPVPWQHLFGIGSFQQTISLEKET